MAAPIFVMAGPDPATQTKIKPGPDPATQFK